VRPRWPSAICRASVASSLARERETFHPTIILDEDIGDEGGVGPPGSCLDIGDVYTPEMVVRTWPLPRVAPRMPSSRTSRSTLQRATSWPARLRAAQSFLAPYT